MLQGFVKWFDENKGYGFIESDSQEYFLHFSEIVMEGYKTVCIGQKVNFIPSKTTKGIKATCVTFS